jgi:hypothetical protein
MAKQSHIAQPMPNSWLLKEWPQGVAPGSTKKARYILRRYKKELIANGAVARIGRDVTFLGQGYAAFLATLIPKFESFECNARRKSTAA